jgi:hypothetical protein
MSAEPGRSAQHSSFSSLRCTCVHSRARPDKAKLLTLETGMGSALGGVGQGSARRRTEALEERARLPWVPTCHSSNVRALPARVADRE